jgi:hypothetical protein
MRKLLGQQSQTKELKKTLQIQLQGLNFINDLTTKNI